MNAARLIVACFALILFSSNRADAVVFDVQVQVTSAPAAPIGPIALFVPAAFTGGTFTYRRNLTPVGYPYGYATTAFLRTLNATVTGRPAAWVYLPAAGVDFGYSGG